MANSEKAKANLHVLESIKDIEKKSLFFENEKVFIYSPGIQSNSTNNSKESVDIRRDTFKKLFEATKPALIVIRYYNDFLIVPVEDLKQLINLDGDTRNKWCFKLEKVDDGTLKMTASKSDFYMELHVHNLVSFEHEMQLRGLEFEETYLENLKADLLIPHVYQYIKSKGFNYSIENIKNLYLALRSKPFVIISGISGTGKTKIVQLFAESIGATEENGQLTLIPVRPDWSDGSELLGYRDIKGEFVEGIFTGVVRAASEHLERPYFVLLDEMNLARVEYYFSDVLSIMESRKKVDGQYTSSPLLPDIDEDLTLPPNLYLIGTVNMDETTHPFSKKVLDRANTIEFNEIDLNDFSFLELEREATSYISLANASLEASYVQLQDGYGQQYKPLIQRVSQQLSEINTYIKPVQAQIGYRVRDEICFYMMHNSEGSLLSEETAFDYCMMQKILPRIAGSGQKIRTALDGLYSYLTDEDEGRYPKSAEKVQEMLGRLDEDGFTSFWI